MNAKTKILIGVLIIGLIGGSGLFVLYILGIIPPWRPGPPVLGTVSISTDKTEYEQGEGITITIKNTLDKSIWYIKETCPPSCCNLHKWENNEWKNLGDPMPCIQFTEPHSIEPKELKPKGNITKQWGMKIGASFVESGKYKLSFYYGLSKDNFTEKTIYSNEFTIVRPTTTTEINCAEKVRYFLSKVPECFESVEKGIEWCNECLARNGIPTLSYDIGPFCNLRTSDAGKICTDSSQCEGICLAENENSKSGKCSETESVLGCVFEMTNGKSLERCFD